MVDGKSLKKAFRSEEQAAEWVNQMSLRRNHQYHHGGRSGAPVLNIVPDTARAVTLNLTDDEANLLLRLLPPKLNKLELYMIDFESRPTAIYAEMGNKVNNHMLPSITY